MRRSCLVPAMVILFVVGFLGLEADAQCLLKQGDRVVIYGDSITEQRLYSRYVQQYIYCRYPDLKVKFYNAGWSGDTAPGGLNRLERDVLSLNPTVVTLFFGMNDGGYNVINPIILNNYTNGTEGIIKKLREKGVRVIVFTPGCIDPDKNKNLGSCGYNKTLEALGTAAGELAKKYNCAFMDVFHPMLAFQTEQKEKNPGFTMIPDAVHPDPQGHLVMACHMLKGFGAEPMPPVGSIDLATGKGEGLKIVTKTDNQVVLEATMPMQVPFWFNAAFASRVRSADFFEPMCQKLTVKGLPEGPYSVSMGGTNAFRTTAEKLAAGVALHGSYSEKGKLVHDLTERKENSYFNLWRDTRLPYASMPEAKQTVDGLMAADDGYHAMIHATAMPVGKTTITITVAPGSANLALGKSYESSDRNTYGWHESRLTDGSWDANPVHCFATGMSDKFPKRVTIDLEQAAQVAVVNVGMPPFGSTKNVELSLSKDGKEFKNVGAHQFAQGKDERHVFAFDTTDARYVRLTYLDHYDTDIGYSKTFCFATEVEVLGPEKKTAGK